MKNTLNIGDRLYKAFGPSHKFNILEFEVFKIERQEDGNIHYFTKCLNPCKKNCNKCFEHMTAKKENCDTACVVVVTDWARNLYDFVSLNDDINIPIGTFDSKCDPQFNYYYVSKYATSKYETVKFFLSQKLEMLKRQITNTENDLSKLNGINGRELEKSRYQERLDALRRMQKETIEEMGKYREQK